jgi:heme-degrading monooxygenase HmoA
MPASPWRTFGSPAPNGDFVALLSYLPLKSYSRVFSLFVYAPQVMKQLSSANGLLGYSLLARPLSKRFWTLSAWANEEALRAFVQHPPHLRIMAALAPQYGRDEIRALDSQRFSTAPAMGRSAAPAIRRLPGPDSSRFWVRTERVIPPARPGSLCLCVYSKIW